MDTPTRPSAREPRTFELRNAEWVEETPPRRPRPPLWVFVPMALAALTGVMLVAFAAAAVLATAALIRVRASVLRLFGRR